MVKRYKFWPGSFVIECGAKNRGALDSTTRRKVALLNCIQFPWPAASRKWPSDSNVQSRDSMFSCRCTNRSIHLPGILLHPYPWIRWRLVIWIPSVRVGFLPVSFFFLNSRKHVTLRFPLRIFTIPGDIILIRAISFFLFFFFYFTNTILVIASLKYSILSEILKRKEKKNNAGVFSLWSKIINSKLF